LGNCVFRKIPAKWSDPIAGLVIGIVLLWNGGVSATAASSSLRLTWSYKSNNTHAGFIIERKTGTKSAFTTLSLATADARSYVDRTVTSGTNYCYRVAAYNDAGSSPYTPQACAVAPAPVLRTLTVTKAGAGTGTVTSSPSGITCGTDCSQTYAGGTTVALSASPDARMLFRGWSGACAGTAPCTVIMDASKSVTATFVPNVLPPVTFTATDNVATEADLPPAAFRFTRTGLLTSAFMVYPTVTGSAIAGADYVSLGSSVSFPAGASNVTKPVTPLQDLFSREGAETVVVTLVQKCDLRRGRPGSALVTIESDD
jgi:hypothetical protein